MLKCVELLFPPDVQEFEMQREADQIKLVEWDLNKWAIFDQISS